MNEKNSHTRPNIEVNDVPPEILIEIFKWIAFEDLHHNVKLVCRKWAEVVSLNYRYPIGMRIDEGTSPRKAAFVLSRFGHKISSLKFRDVSADVITSLPSERLSSLKALSVRWSRTSLAGGRMPVTYFTRVIDQCPALRSLKIRECWLRGNADALFERAKEKRITKFTFANEYLHVDGAQKWYDLRDMEEVRVPCHFSGTDDPATGGVERFCSNNRHSLKSLGLRLDSWTVSPDGADGVLAAIASCTRLTKLHLAGCSAASAQGLRRLASLPELRCLKIEIDRSQTTTTVVEFFGHPFVKRLRSLAVGWSRNVSAEELECLSGAEALTSLSLAFVDDRRAAAVIYPAVLKMARKNRRLKKLTLEATRFDFCDILTRICSASPDLCRAKIRTLKKRPWTTDLRKQLNLISPFFNYQYVVSGTEFEITLTKKAVIHEVDG